MRRPHDLGLAARAGTPLDMEEAFGRSVFLHPRHALFTKHRRGNHTVMACSNAPYSDGTTRSCAATSKKDGVSSPAPRVRSRFILPLLYRLTMVGAERLAPVLLAIATLLLHVIRAAEPLKFAVEYALNHEHSKK